MLVRFLFRTNWKHRNSSCVIINLNDFSSFVQLCDIKANESKLFWELVGSESFVARYVFFNSSFENSWAKIVVCQEFAPSLPRLRRACSSLCTFWLHLTNNSHTVAGDDACFFNSNCDRILCQRPPRSLWSVTRSGAVRLKSLIELDYQYCALVFTKHLTVELICHFVFHIQLLL